jgi:integrase/recombinase XerD
LSDLEQQRGNSVRSRNIRLSAIRAFFRLVALRDPASIGIATRVLAIPLKREDKKLIGYLTRPDMHALLATPEQSKWSGRRDHALLLLLYNSGARVSEVITLTRAQVCFDASTFVHLLGKGRKERTVPLWHNTAQVLQAWFRERGDDAKGLAVPSARGKPLSRDGVAYLLTQAVLRALPTCPRLAHQHISPHVIRHTTAMPLLQAGVDIATIALWLGHESIETPPVYRAADLAMKEQALAKRDPLAGEGQRFHADDALLAFRASLYSCRGVSYESVALDTFANETRHDPELGMTELMPCST